MTFGILAFRNKSENQADYETKNIFLFLYENSKYLVGGGCKYHTTYKPFNFFTFKNVTQKFLSAEIKNKSYACDYFFLCEKIKNCRKYTVTEKANLKKLYKIQIFSEIIIVSSTLTA